LLSSSIRTEARDAIQGLKGGADDYLLKPLDPYQTLAKVEAFLRIKVLQDELQEANADLAETVEELELNRQELAQKNEALQREKKVIRNSLLEKTYLLDELESSNQQLAEVNRQLIRNLDHLVDMLSRIVEYHRLQNKGHARTVGRIAEYMARRLALDPAEIDHIRTAALLHELGTVALVGHSVVCPRKNYSKKEWQIVGQYPILGARLLQEYEGLEKEAELVLYLHEHVDGSGTPEGLTGEKIPLGSRILLLANEWDELYQKSSNQSAVSDLCKVLQVDSNHLFDPQLLPLLFDWIDQEIPAERPAVDMVNLSTISTGMRLARDLITNTGIKLVPEGTILTESMIESIMKYNQTDPLTELLAIYRN